MRRVPLLLAAGCALAAAIAVLRLLLGAALPESAPAADGAAPLAVLALLLGAAGGWCAASTRARRRFAARQREARSEIDALEQLLDAWQWRSDAQHTLLRLVAPQAGPASNRVEPGRRLWQHFDAGDDSLRERMAAHAPLVDVAVTQPDGTGWLLRGVPRFDAGGFAGYVGTARAAAAADPGAADLEAFGLTVGHDLRAPLRVVEGFARILKEDYAGMLDRIAVDHLDRVLGAAARMNGMIDALLALARLSAQPLARRPVDLSQLAAQVIDELQRTQRGRRVQVRIAPALLAHGDPALLRRVLENLLGNAWKYSAKTPAAQIVFERASANGDPGGAAFVVRDNGAGFDMRFADRLFSPFQRLHSASDYPGSGIGLASVRRIVRRHGGDIRAEAEVGRGANFYFTLGARAPHAR